MLAKLLVMKLMAKFLFVFAFILAGGSALASANSGPLTDTNGEGKTQQETTVRPKPQKYNFTLFTIFDPIPKVKQDSVKVKGNGQVTTVKEGN